VDGGGGEVVSEPIEAESLFDGAAVVVLFAGPIASVNFFASGNVTHSLEVAAGVMRPAANASA